MTGSIPQFSHANAAPKFERNVPIPEGRGFSGKNSGLAGTLSQMQVGDSYLVPARLGRRNHLRHCNLFRRLAAMPRNRKATGASIPFALCQMAFAFGAFVDFQRRLRAASESQLRDTPMTIPSLQAQIARSVGYFSDAMADTGNASPAYAYRKTLAASEETLREMQNYLRVMMKEGHLENDGYDAAGVAIDALSDLIGSMQNMAE